MHRARCLSSCATAMSATAKHTYLGALTIIYMWHTSKSCPVLQAAGAIHSDFERGFICAEVMHYDELHELGSEHAVKAGGKYRQEGKNYVVADGDIIYFKFNVGCNSAAV